MSADNRPMAVLPRAQDLNSGEEEAAAVTLDLLPRVRYRVRLGSDTFDPDEAATPSICFESGVLICPEPGAKSAVVVNLSDRIASLRSGSRKAFTAPQQQQSGGYHRNGPRPNAWRTTERAAQSSS
jgi:hypothetical protein